MPTPRNLLPPSAAELDHVAAVEDSIRRRIVDSGGLIPFSEFMEMALYAPGLGYYNTGTWKLGAGGDFTTAPELGGLFAACVARQCEQVLKELGEADILEFGAGSGALCVDLLSRLQQSGILPRRYLILETSADLRRRQQQCVQSLDETVADRIVWLDDLEELEFNGVVIANEVLDAMPVERFTVTESGYERHMVGLESSGFLVKAVTPERSDTAILDIIHDYTLQPGYTSEYNARAGAFVKTVAALMQRGVVILIDYGYSGAEYYHAERTTGTLRCHYRHRAHNDPLTNAGIQDITAHVDFSAAAQAGLHAGLVLLGFTNQASFLVNCGLMEIAGSSRLEPEAQMRLANEIKYLTLPSEMGEAFKVLALGKSYDIPLCGFSRYDRRQSLCVENNRD